MIEAITTIVVNNGIGVACIVYFMIRDYKLMEDLKDTMSVVRDYLHKKEDK